ncbi:DUF4031 domain-containing protein [Phycicoccus endophyticus]|uniref:DUF4031 domain-containing protein n=1 Tax=Phycicoccus endophyticus TaxID=1690220 RepID=A0A7G9R256_9MICO|nr:DUF4031 domain-containing protein [Phycicoccus endophyticus]NHI19667.1 DUF4031 domain-containing protein [Phycicoccus endophyticus]QNN49681.1 DUF4031 domain-containing protein [Phycicoccus endophyticus]GGL34042.1 hypothetical protein GCM10012283_15620 [Phycicoccus endophyticus]
MAILVDPPAVEAYGRRWSHLVSDASLEELHAFAQGCGLPRQAFEGDHYDVPEERYPSVVAAGARPVSARELLAALLSSGLRIRKRRGDKGVARVLGVGFPDGTRADVDLIRSPREVPPARVFAAMTFVRDAAGHHLVVHSVRRDQWGPPGGWREPPETVRENAVRELREETGLVVDVGELRPVGYERFHHRGDGRWRPGQDLMQLYTVHLRAERPPLLPGAADVDGRRWVTWPQLRTLCGEDFYWPVLEATLSPPAG